jgi:kynureninase
MEVCDLSHYIGNYTLSLHKHKVDFAVWCSYKYLNSGPGSIAWAFIHEKKFGSKSIPRLEGWWGHDEHERFKMKKKFVPMHGADAWQLSTFTVMNAASHLASLSIFEEAGINALRKKSEQLTGYAEYLLRECDPEAENFVLITPSKTKERGCQLSIEMRKNGQDVFNKLIKSGVVADWREPSVIRIAPAPLYNTFEEVYTFVKRFQKALLK